MPSSESESEAITKTATSLSSGRHAALPNFIPSPYGRRTRTTAAFFINYTKAKGYEYPIRNKKHSTVERELVFIISITNQIIFYFYLIQLTSYTSHILIFTIYGYTLSMPFDDAITILGFPSHSGKLRIINTMWT